MEKNIKSIKLILKNCETITLKINEITSINIDNIIKYKGFNNEYDYDQSNLVYMEIPTKSNRKYKKFGTISNQTIFKRLSETKDITQIELDYGNKIKSFYINYEEDKKGENQNQLVVIYDDALILEIADQNDLSLYLN